jgi:hypothetical protein
MAEVIVGHIRKKNPLRPPAAEVYQHLTIEPAASYINRFDRSLLAKHLDDRLREKLREFTGQLHWQVFEDMTADNKPQTVTHKLAVRTYEFLIHIGVKTSEIDPPQFSYDPRHHLYIPSPYETFDLDESTLPKLPTL